MAEAALKRKPEETHEAERKRFTLGMDTFQLKESKNPGYWHCAPDHAAIDDLLQPDYWANFTGKMRRNSTIEVHWADSSQFAELYILDFGRNWASVALIRHIRLERTIAPPKVDQFQIGHHGPVDQWRIANLSNGSVLKAGFATEEDARKFLAEHLKKF